MCNIISSSDVMEIDKNTLWMVGDSFTAGDGTFVHKHHKYPNNRKIPFFGDSIAQKLDMKLENRGKSGGSNDQILDRLLQVIHEAKEGDFILTGETFPMRTQIFVEGSTTPHFESAEEWHIKTTDLELDQLIIGSDGCKFEDWPVLVAGEYNKVKMRHYSKRSVKELFDDTVKYVVDVREHQGQLTCKYWSKRFELAHTLANQKGVGTILWNQARISEETHLQTIYEDSGGGINDFHLSYKGQHMLGKSILKSIQKKYGKITRNKDGRLHSNWTI